MSSVLRSYDSGRFITPPLTKRETPPSMLPFWETEMRWWAEAKKEGTHSLIAVSPDKELTAWTRLGEPHKLWSWTSGSAAAFKRLPGRGWYLIDAELMHSKGGGVRDTNFVHDVLVDDGVYLIGDTYQTRYERLLNLFVRTEHGFDGPKSAADRAAFVVDGHTQVAKVYKQGSDFAGLFKDLVASPTNEGIMLKDPQGKLTLSHKVEWMVKCRKASDRVGSF